MGERSDLDGPGTPADRYDLQRGWVPLAVLALVVSLPILLAAVGAARTGWVPTADSGTIAIRAIDMWTSHRPLVGQFSLAGSDGSEQVFSPGPLLYLALAPAARFGPAWSLPLTMAALSCGCFTLALAAARRIGGWWFAVIVAVGLLGTMRASGAGTFIEVWNPWAGLAPFAALILVCWYTALGHRWWLVPAVALASFIVQAHLTYLAPSAVLLVIAVAGAWWPSASPDPEPAGDPDGDPGAGAARSWWWRPAPVAVLVGLVLWALPLWQQVRSSPGNLSLVLGAAQGEGSTWGPAVGVNVWWRASGIFPAFAGTRLSLVDELGELHTPAGAGAWIGSALLVLVLLATAWSALRRGQRDVLVGALISLGLAVAAIATAARLPFNREIVAPYAMRWTVTAGLVPWIALALAVIRFDLLSRWLPERPGLRGAAIAVPALLVVALLIPRSDRSAWMVEPSRDAGDAVIAATEPGDRILLADSGKYDVVMTPALAWRLREAGRSPVLVRDAQLAAGPSYAATGVRCDAVLVLRPTSDPAAPGSEEVAVVLLDDDGPGPAERVAVDLAPDDSADGRC